VFREPYPDELSRNLRKEAGLEEEMQGVKPQVDGRG
jgi:hypothetical protein